MAGQMKNQILKSEKSITLKLLRLHISRWQLAQVGSPTSPPPPNLGINALRTPCKRFALMLMFCPFLKLVTLALSLMRNLGAHKSSIIFTNKQISYL